MSTVKSMVKWLTLLIILTLIQGANAVNISFSSNWGPNGYSVVTQSSSGVEVNFSITQLQIESLIQDGDTLDAISIPGVYLPNIAGAPNLPAGCRFIAIPQGATAIVTIEASRTITYQNLNIAAAPEPQFESAVWQNPSPNPLIYQANEFYPENPVIIMNAGRIRGVDVVLLGVCPFQYNPVTRQLLVYQDLRVRVDFVGGNGHFGADGLRSIWYEPILAGNLLNYASLENIYTIWQRYNYGTTDDDRIGAEFYIIVPNASFVYQANRIKNWRTKQGIKTQIVLNDTLEGGYYGSLYELMEFFYVFGTWDPEHYIAPSAMLLMADESGTLGIPSGSYNFHGTHFGITDNWYADMDGDDNDIPDLVVGRMCARNVTELSTMVTRLLNYEESPPISPSFYQNDLFTGGWQSDRWFLMCNEIIRGYFINELGKTTHIQYSWSGTNPPPYLGPGAWWCTNPYAGPTTFELVDYFGPAPGLGYIQASSSYLNNQLTGNTAGVVSYITNGVPFIFYRNHGSPTGWNCAPVSYLNYQISNWANQTHPAGQYPFIYSVTCLTGKFNHPGTDGSFAEAVTRMHSNVVATRGALGIIAASDTSWSFANDAFLWGNVDHFWPEFDPYYGENIESPTRNCPNFARVNGLVYLVGTDWSNFMSEPPFDPYNYKKETSNLYQGLCDPYTTVYTQIPLELNVVKSDGLSTTPNGNFWVKCQELNALICLSSASSGSYNIVATKISQGDTCWFTLTQTQYNYLAVTVTKPNYLRYQWLYNYNPHIKPILGGEGSSVVQVTPERQFSISSSPNPFNAATTISFTLPEAAKVNLNVYDATGRVVATLINGWCEQGSQELTFDGSLLPSGIYFYRLTAGKHQATQKLVLVK